MIAWARAVARQRAPYDPDEAEGEILAALYARPVHERIKYRRRIANDTLDRLAKAHKRHAERFEPFDIDAHGQTVDASYLTHAELLLAQGATEYQIARALHVSRSTVSRWKAKLRAA